VEEFLMRLALFTALPVLLGALIVTFDRTATGPVRRAEAFLIPLFLVGVGGAGMSGFISHVFISDPVARSIGWEPGSPFQLHVGFAYLAIGLLGAIAAERRDGFREATVAAAAVFEVGATVVHLIAAAATGELPPGNVLLTVANLAKPALLIWFLLALRRAERAEPPTIVLRGWMIPIRRGSVAAGTIAAAAYLAGYPTGQIVALSLAGAVVAVVVFWWIVSRAATHRARAAEK
jgi:hypothetical protein